MTEWIRVQRDIRQERKNGGSFIFLVRNDLSLHTVQQNPFVVICHA